MRLVTDAWARPQVWAQWEEDSAWSDSLLTTFQTSFPSKTHEEEDSEEQISKKLSVCQVSLYEVSSSSGRRRSL